MGSRPTFFSRGDLHHLRLAINLARRGLGTTSPNPTVGAVLVKGGKIIGRGRTAPAGGPHAEIEALRDAQRRGHLPKGATLYVTLEPCCTHGRTPPCTDAIVVAGIKRVVVGATDPNPRHSGRAFKILRRAGIEVVPGVLADECARLNEAFNHWIVRRTPFVTVKAAMTLDGKIATASGESKWITGEKARAHGMKLRQHADAVLVGINTILADDPGLTVRAKNRGRGNIEHPTSNIQHPKLRRIVLDTMARVPLNAKVVSDEHATWTTIVVSKSAPKRRMAALAKRVNVLVAPTIKVGRVTPCAPFSESHSRSRRARSDAPYHQIDVRWLMRKLGTQNVTNLLVEGGGEVNAAFLLGGLAQRVAFFYAPKILGGRDARRAVAGEGVKRLAEVIRLQDIEWKRLGPDLLLTARVGAPKRRPAKHGQ
jgi:diaminohydroxyphosphoribosylaminopyrimidine deaminase/5-amino-6-(5-phosphoribosylamino)uracil reductase